LAAEERAILIDSSRQVSAEKRLQLATYSEALKDYLEDVVTTKDTPDDNFIARLRAEFAVTQEEHKAVLNQVLGGSSEVAAKLAAELRTIERSAQTVKSLELNPSPTHNYLADLLRRRRDLAVESLVRGLTFSLADRRGTDFRNGLCTEDESAREAIVEEL